MAAASARSAVSGDYIHCENVQSIGDSVTCNQGRATYAQYLLKQDWLLPKIPDGVSYERASLACCGLGPSYGAMQLMGVDAFTTILITGAGPVGLGAVVNARFRRRTCDRGRIGPLSRRSAPGRWAPTPCSTHATRRSSPKFVN